MVFIGLFTINEIFNTNKSSRDLQLYLCKFVESGIRYQFFGVTGMHSYQPNSPASDISRSFREFKRSSTVFRVIFQGSLMGSFKEFLGFKRELVSKLSKSP